MKRAVAAALAATAATGVIVAGGGSPANATSTVATRPIAATGVWSSPSYCYTYIKNNTSTSKGYCQSGGSGYSDYYGATGGTSAGPAGWNPASYCYNYIINSADMNRRPYCYYTSSDGLYHINYLG